MHVHRRLTCLLAVLTIGCGQATRASSTPSATSPSPVAVNTPSSGAASPAATPARGTASGTDSCDSIEFLQTFDHSNIGPVRLFRDSRGGSIDFASEMAVNTDGAPDSYHPDDIGITHICNGVSLGASCTWQADCLTTFRQAKSEGFRGPTRICFFAMVTDGAGVPIIQGAGDPKPGFFVSTTTLTQPGASRQSPAAYLDSNEIPFIVIPTSWQRQEFQGLGLGDYAVVMRKSTGAIAVAIIGDLGPKTKLGEGSVALHAALGNDPFQIKNGVRRARRGIGGRDVVYVLFPGSRRTGQPITKQSIDQEGRRLLAAIGGEERLRRCASRL